MTLSQILLAVSTLPKLEEQTNKESHFSKLTAEKTKGTHLGAFGFSILF